MSDIVASAKLFLLMISIAALMIVSRFFVDFRPRAKGLPSSACASFRGMDVGFNSGRLDLNFYDFTSFGASHNRHIRFSILS
ncbi:hypothetical protein [Sphingomonas sp. PAMC 26621]|uniref:hypothetical protein n=1 Tax=Sphingomonas sp. PAMC 26621 TaxID=1112213 RepID=UPI0002882A34|nr:hypothetical protein [Sphingomonas sp. PAMC 26621]